MNSDLIKNIIINDYNFKNGENPYHFSIITDEKSQELKDIADKVYEESVEDINKKDLLVRAIQSGKHSESRDELIEKILKTGVDYDKSDDEKNIIFAAELDKQQLQKIFAGFHQFKPKCDEKPQYPIDIVVVFDKNSYENIKYIHPRHNVEARDKWKYIEGENFGIIKILTIN